jgi:hypothetical protein
MAQLYCDTPQPAINALRTSRESQRRHQTGIALYRSTASAEKMILQKSTVVLF